MSDFETLAKTAEKLAAGETTSIDLCEQMLVRVVRLNPTIGAYSDVTAETARTEAIASDKRRDEKKTIGPLDGIPIAVKDLIDTTPAVCKAGLEHRTNYRPTEDAEVVKRLRQTGAVIIGVTETDPGAFSTATPQATNPLDIRRSVGGSSGGSGASVAAGLAYGAIGTDTGGSVRIPAACCSIYGFKPTWGRVDAAGAMPLAPSLDHVGPMARSVEDLHILQSVLDPDLAKTLSEDLDDNVTIGVASEYFADAEDQIKTAMAQAIGKLAAYQIILRDVALPRPDDIMNFHMVNLPKEAADFHTHAYPEEWSSYPEIARATVEKGRNVAKSDYDKTVQLRSEARAHVNAALANVDAIIVPVMPIDAPFRDANSFVLKGKTFTKLEATIRYTSLFNQTGHPVISMPVATMPDGRTISLQLIGRMNSDGNLLRLGHKLQQVFDLKIDYSSIMRSQQIDETGSKSNNSVEGEFL